MTSNEAFEAYLTATYPDPDMRDAMRASERRTWVAATQFCANEGRVIAARLRAPTVAGALSGAFTLTKES